MSGIDDWLTTGDFDTEATSVAALLSVLGNRWFTPYREVPGHYLFARPHTENSQPRADLILRPTRELVTAGWTYGCLGVECKRSGVKLGPLVAQVLDYQAAAFYPDGGTGIVPTLWAMWPAGQIAGPMESVLAQRRILTADVSGRRGGPWVVFRCGGRNALLISAEGVVVGSVVSGAKRGSRG